MLRRIRRAEHRREPIGICCGVQRHPQLAMLAVPTAIPTGVSGRTSEVRLTPTAAAKASILGIKHQYDDRHTYEDDGDGHRYQRGKK